MIKFATGAVLMGGVLLVQWAVSGPLKLAPAQTSVPVRTPEQWEAFTRAIDKQTEAILRQTALLEERAPLLRRQTELIRQRIAAMEYRR